MCGIAGEIDLSKKVLQNKSYLSILAHRGPHNSKKLKINNNICLYHTRLKIIDLSDGSNQPMLSEDKRFVICYNGELYNYLEIKKKLEDKGYKFLTNGDTEVFLKGFIEFGKNFFKLANGIFAVSIYDKKNKLLFISRDFVGVKPLYYFLEKTSLIFSSEMKAIVSNMKQSVKLNKEVLNEYLYYKYVSGKDTLVQNIKKFLPGKVYVFDLNNKKISLKTFNFFNFNEKTQKDTFLDTVHQTKTFLKKSVNLQLQSDANIGIQLSGGIDSTLITDIACKERHIKNLYFSSFQNFKKDEHAYANFVAKRLKLNFEKINLNKKFFFENIKKANYYLDEPLNHPHSLAIYQISKKAKKNVSVILAGEGADEIFFGYERYKDINKTSSDEKLIKNGAFLRTKTDLKLFELFKTSNYGEEHLNRQKILDKLNIENKIKKFQFFETQTHLQSLLLRSDKMMMANSIEARVPFLDKDLFNYALNINDTIKKQEDQKMVLKKILLDMGYPKNFVKRKKIGYIIPYNDWIKSQKEFKHDLNDEILLSLFGDENIKTLINNLNNNKSIYTNAKFYWLLSNLKNFIYTFKINL